MLLSHSLTIANLQPSTHYFFRVGSMVAKGNGPDPAVPDDNNPNNIEGQFFTDSGPDVSAPQISSFSVQPVTATTRTLLVVLRHQTLPPRIDSRTSQLTFPRGSISPLLSAR